MVRCRALLYEVYNVLKFDENSFECVHEELLDFKTMKIEELQPCVLASLIMNTKNIGWMSYGTI